MTSTYHHYSNTNQQQIISLTSGRSSSEEDRNFAPARAKTTSTSTSTEWDWDFKLNTLLEDLQKSIRPLPTLYEHGNRVQITRDRDHGQGHEGDRDRERISRSSTTEEYKTREYKWKSPRSLAPKTDDSPKAKLIELGQSLKESEAQAHSQPFYLTPRVDPRRSSGSGRENVKRSAQATSNDYRQQPQMEYIDASNTVTILRSTESSPVPPLTQSQSQPDTRRAIRVTTPVIERKEYYSSSTSTAYSSTTKNIHASPSSPDFDFIPPQNYPKPQKPQYYDDRITTEEKEEKVVFYKKPEPPAPAPTYPIQQAIGQPLFSSTPIRNQATPQQRQTYHQRNESYKTSCQTDFSDNFADYQEPPSDNRPIADPSPKFYTATATTTRTVTRKPGDDDTVDSSSPMPIRVFPTNANANGNLRSSGRGQRSNGSAIIPQEPPKRLDQLLATFDESFVETSKIVGDGGGPHKSHPYGPGTYPIPRSVRIDESANIEKEIIEKYAAGLSSKSSHNNNNIMSYSNQGHNNGNITSISEPIANATASMAGPPVFYPIQPNEQLFSKTQSEMESHYASNGHGHGKMKMDRKYESWEKSKESRVEKGGGGAIPVPVCLPICCAAPCVIL